jgi:AsmA protein
MANWCVRPTMLKRILLIVGSLLLLVVLAAVALIVFVDPNDYKPQISAYASRLAGRDVRIVDDIRLSIFPWVGVRLGKVVVENARGFGPEPLARIDRAQIQLRLTPLLRRRLEFDTIRVEGLELHLEKDRSGRANWNGIGPSSQAPSPPPAGEPALALPAALGIEGLDLRNGTVSWRDASSGSAFEIEGLTIKSGRVENDRPIDVAADFTVRDRSANLEARVTVKTRLMPRLDEDRLTADPLDAKVQVSGPKAPAFPLAVEVKGKVSATPRDVQLSDVDAHVNDSTLTGRLAVIDFDRPAYQFEFAVDRLDADRYLPPSNPSQAASAPAAPIAVLDLPRERLRTLDVDGALKIGTLRLGGLTIRDLSARAKAHKGMIAFAPITASLYGGRYAGEIRIDSRGEVPGIALQESLSGVQAAPLLKDAFGIDVFSGVADLKASITARGRSERDLLSSLSGTADVALRDGVIKGFNAAESVREVEARLKGITTPKSGTRQTDFTELSATLHIANGIARNDDLRGSSPYLRLGGNGTADLVKNRIDYRLRARLVETATGQGGAKADELRGVDIPIRISGALSKPEVGVDGDAVAELLRERLTKELERKGRENLEHKLKELLKGLSR